MLKPQTTNQMSQSLRYETASTSPFILMTDNSVRRADRPATYLPLMGITIAAPGFAGLGRFSTAESLRASVLCE